MLPRLSADEVRVRRAQLALEDLAAGVLGQAVGDGHVPGRLVAGESLAAERHELVGVDRLPVPGDDDRGDGLDPARVWGAEDGDLRDEIGRAACRERV